MRTPPLIPWPLLIAARIAILAAVYVTVAHAEDFWHVDMPGYNAPVLVLRMPSAELLSIACRMPRTEDAACADRKENACIVYLGPRANACAESHEVNGHCKGKNHRLTYGLVQDCHYND